MGIDCPVPVDKHKVFKKLNPCPGPEGVHRGSGPPPPSPTEIPNSIGSYRNNQLDAPWTTTKNVRAFFCQLEPVPPPPTPDENSWFCTCTPSPYPIGRSKVKYINLPVTKSFGNIFNPKFAYRQMNNGYEHLKSDSMTYTLDSWCGVKSLDHFFLKVVMLLIKLKGIKVRTKCKQKV